MLSATVKSSDRADLALDRRKQSGGIGETSEPVVSGSTRAIIKTDIFIARAEGRQDASLYGDDTAKNLMVTILQLFAAFDFLPHDLRLLGMSSRFVRRFRRFCQRLEPLNLRRFLGLNPLEIIDPAANQSVRSSKHSVLMIESSTDPDTKLVEALKAWRWDSRVWHVTLDRLGAEVPKFLFEFLELFGKPLFIDRKTAFPNFPANALDLVLVENVIHCVGAQSGRQITGHV